MAFKCWINWCCFNINYRMLSSLVILVITLSAVLLQQHSAHFTVGTVMGRPFVQDTLIELSKRTHTYKGTQSFLRHTDESFTSSNSSMRMHNLSPWYLPEYKSQPAEDEGRSVKVATRIIETRLSWGTVREFKHQAKRHLQVISVFL